MDSNPRYRFGLLITLRRGKYAGSLSKMYVAQKLWAAVVVISRI
jgi:hypothetical protein